MYISKVKTTASNIEELDELDELDELTDQIKSLQAK